MLAGHAQQEALAAAEPASAAICVSAQLPFVQITDHRTP